MLLLALLLALLASPPCAREASTLGRSLKEVEWV
jgi:hypothetical protein